MQPTMTFSNLSRESEKRRPSIKNIFNKNIFRTLTSVKFLAILIVVFQLIILYVLINPINILNQLNSVQIVNRVSRLTVVPGGEVPTAIGTVGDNALLPSADTLRKDNEIQSQVYKDAKDGDYVIVYSNKMIIFRDSENRIIYEGPTPAQILSTNQQNLLNNLITKVKEAGIVPQDSTETPIAQVITKNTLQNFQNINPGFYSEARENDVIAQFVTANKIVLYRAEGNVIVKYGEMAIN
jgi:hypothetical protein